MTRRHRAATAFLGLVLLVSPACGGGDEPDAAASTTTTAVLSADTLPVLVAAVEIPAGTEAARAFDDGLLRADTVTRAQFPDDAIVTLELIEGMVAAEPLTPGTIITAGMFVDPSPNGAPAPSPVP